MTKTVLTGTTGGLGSRVLHHLVRTLHVPPEDLIISLFNPSKAPEETKNLGIELRKGDYTSPESLHSSFQGADRLFLVSYPSPAHKIRVDAHVNAINAARDVGIKHIYYTSLAFADDSKATVMQAHLDTAAYLRQVSRDTDLTYTIIKEGIYTESFPLYLNFQNFDTQPSEREAVLPLNPSKGIAWILKDDLGEATARIIIEDSSDPKWKNQTLLLSGSETFTLNQIASTITSLKGWHDQPLTVQGIGEVEYISYMAELKTGDRNDAQARAGAALWADAYAAIERGELATVDPLCEKTLGRKTSGMGVYLERLLGDKGGVRPEELQYA